MYIVHSIDKCIAIPEVNVNEVKTITLTIKNSASGYEEPPASILKQCIDLYIEPFTCLINMSISQGTFPNQLKLTRVIPLFKRGRRTTGTKLLTHICSTISFKND